MAYAVSSPGIDYAEFSCHGLQVLVVVRILEAHLDGVVVNVADRQLCLDPVQAHGFKL